MKNNTLLKSGAVLLAAAMLTLAACKRNSNNDNTTPALSTADDNGGYASDGAKLESTSNDVISIADIAATTGGSNLRTTGTTLGGCATVTNDTVHHVLDINFGTSDCTCLDGKKRKGEIIVNYTGKYKDSGSVHTISYSGYFVNDIQVSGFKTVINEGTNTLGQVFYNVTVSDTMTLSTDSIITWNGTRVRTWLAGYLTTDRADDVYGISGTTTLTRANGHSFLFTVSAADPLKVAWSCPWIEAGQITITGATLAEARILDYGAVGSSCNPAATLTIGSHTYTIILK